eukprot:Pgem_evm1s11135
MFAFRQAIIRTAQFNGARQFQVKAAQQTPLVASSSAFSPVKNVKPAHLNIQEKRARDLARRQRLASHAVKHRQSH